MGKCAGVAVVTSVLALPAGAQLIVLDELGPTAPVPFVVEAERAKRRAPPPPAAAPAAPGLPVTTAWLSPGRVQPAVLDRVISPAPLAIIGDDPRSRRWLREQAAYLRRIGARIWVVELAAIDTLRSIERAAPGLTVHVATADALKGVLPQPHYPLLIHGRQVTQ